MGRILLSVAALCVVAGCLGPGERDPGPLQVNVQSFRLLQDEFNAEWVLEFRNLGALPITRLEVATVHASLYDGAAFEIDGLTYDAPEDAPHDLKKFRGGRSAAPEGLRERPSHLLPWGTTLQPGGATPVRVAFYFDHLNYTKPDGAGWRSFEQEGGVVNATDFYHLSFDAHYVYQDYEWRTLYSVACFNREGERITLIPPPSGVCDDHSALFNRDAPKWDAYTSS